LWISWVDYIYLLSRVLVIKYSIIIFITSPIHKVAQKLQQHCMLQQYCRDFAAILLQILCCICTTVFLLHKVKKVWYNCWASSWIVFEERFHFYSQFSTNQIHIVNSFFLLDAILCLPFVKKSLIKKINLQLTTFFKIKSVLIKKKRNIKID